MRAKNLILIVDDEKLNREILINTLSDEFEILQASNGQEAFLTCFNLVLYMNMRMVK